GRQASGDLLFQGLNMDLWILAHSPFLIDFLQGHISLGAALDVTRVGVVGVFLERPGRETPEGRVLARLVLAAHDCPGLGDYGHALWIFARGPGPLVKGRP